MKPQLLLDAERAPEARDWSRGIIVDNFAGGGGASTGIEAALRRQVAVAINHDPEAVAMHAANHPGTRHLCQSVWAVDPLEAVTFDGQPQPVRLAWFSPDCKHFSKAKGAKPVEKNIRDLAWVVHHWIDRLGPMLRPAIIALENVEEFRTWGPLGTDGRPCPAGKGKTFDRWIAKLRRAGYRVQWKELRACDYGAPTSRKRLFLIARCDRQRIIWPKPTHGRPDSEAVRAGRLKPWRTAAEIIDWTIPCPSIFERPRPLKDATCRRIAAGIMRYVIDAAQPFIVPLTHHGSAERLYGLEAPLPTAAGANRGEMAKASSTLIQIGYGERDGQAPRVPGLDKPLGTIVAGGGKHALVAAFMAQHNTMPRGGLHPGREATRTISTITARGTQQNIVTSHLLKLRNNCFGQDGREPLGTLTSGGTHYGEVRAFLVKYYGNERDGHGLAAPLGTVTARDRFGLVTVTIAGEEYALVDIGMRMLTPRELFNAQGFPADYIIDLDYNGKPLTKTAQVRMCGNSVSPVMAEALARANAANDDGAERLAA